jgi:hypothetical protein
VMNAGLYPDAATAELRRRCEELAAAMFDIASGKASRDWLGVDASSLSAWRARWDELVRVIQPAYQVSWTQATRVVQLVATNWDLVAHNVDVMLDEKHARIQQWMSALMLEGHLTARPAGAAEYGLAVTGGPHAGAFMLAGVDY